MAACCLTCPILNYYLHPKSVPPTTSILVMITHPVSHAWSDKAPPLFIFPFSHLPYHQIHFVDFNLEKLLEFLCVLHAHGDCFSSGPHKLTFRKITNSQKKYLLSSYHVPVNILVTEAKLINPVNIKPTFYWENHNSTVYITIFLQE